MSGEGFNRVLLLGNLGADPELRGAVLKLRLATSERYMDRDKKWQNRTEWHAVVVFGKRAEGLAKLLQKGDRIFVEGSLRTSAFEARDGQKREKTEVIASNVVLNGKPNGGAPGRNPDDGGDDYSGDFEKDPF